MIDNLIQYIMGFHYSSGLDLNMGYLSMPLDEPLKVILTIIRLFRLFEYQVLSPGVKAATYIFQVQMTSLFSHFRSNAPKSYLKDVLYTSGNGFDDHYLEVILEILKKKGKQVNARKPC